jgi:peptidoglycan/LPS O-acetylase OafA/YrhL
VTAMKFRNDINGLRAIAVIGVVFFHFNPGRVSGGFAGVDVFFVISGFLMTGIIFSGIKNDSFSLLRFYISRFNRIAPALIFLCFALLLFGWLFLGPLQYRQLSLHTFSSLSFVSNINYWMDAGYFDSLSREKWLLHTWSLSVEWQFYFVYPLLIILVGKVLSLNNIKKFVLLCSILSFCLAVFSASRWPSLSYYSLPTRAWEMLIGGLLYLYPLNVFSINKKALEVLGLALIGCSYLLIDNSVLWPGLWTTLPVLGVCLVIISNRQESLFTGNVFFKLIGKCSYSIYLWHWPVAVYGYYLISPAWWKIGIGLSFVLGIISYYLVENFKFKLIAYDKGVVFLKLGWLPIIAMSLAMVIFLNNGFESRVDHSVLGIQKSALSSSYRERCHILSYSSPKNACTYFNGDVSWAVFGDSHIVEIGYALAKRLESHQAALKHFSFSACPPSFQKGENFSNCAVWYDEVIEEIINDKKIQNVVFSHRYTASMFGDSISNFPHVYDQLVDERVISIRDSINNTIEILSKHKKNVFVYYPIPELGRNIHTLNIINSTLDKNNDSIVGSSLEYYKKRNAYIISNFDNRKFPNNVHLLKPEDAFCDASFCFASAKGKALYFDDNHPSLFGAKMLVDLIPEFKL